MKKFINALIVVSMLTMVSACGDTKTIDGATYDTYGLFTENSKKNPKIKYELIVGNVIWGVLFFETIIGPIYFFGFSLFEPVGLDCGDDDKGVLNSNQTESCDVNIRN